jgi:hypothetical protein
MCVDTVVATSVCVCGGGGEQTMDRHCHDAAQSRHVCTGLDVTKTAGCYVFTQ